MVSAVSPSRYWETPKLQLSVPTLVEHDLLHRHAQPLRGLVRHRPSEPGARMMNSSPPQRASRSEGRIRLQHTLGQRHQHRIADLMAVAVVDRLEMINVVQHQAERRDVRAWRAPARWRAPH